LFSNCLNREDTTNRAAEEPAEQAAEYTTASAKPLLVAEADLIHHTTDGVDFWYPQELGDLTFAAHAGEQWDYTSSSEDVGFVTYHAVSKHLVYSQLERDKRSLYLLRSDRNRLLLDWLSHSTDPEREMFNTD